MEQLSHLWEVNPQLRKWKVELNAVAPLVKNFVTCLGPRLRADLLGGLLACTAAQLPGFPKLNESFPAFLRQRTVPRLPCPGRRPTVQSHNKVAVPTRFETIRQCSSPVHGLCRTQKLREPVAIRRRETRNGKNESRQLKSISVTVWPTKAINLQGLF